MNFNVDLNVFLDYAATYDGLAWVRVRKNSNFCSNTFLLHIATNKP